MRILELSIQFDQEKERMLVYMIKNKIHAGGLVKKLKKMHYEARDALLTRYFMKCKNAHCEKFFDWRQNYLRLSFQQRIVVDLQIKEEYACNPSFSSNKITNFKQIRLP